MTRLKRTRRTPDIAKDDRSDSYIIAIAFLNEKSNLSLMYQILALTSAEKVEAAQVITADMCRFDLECTAMVKPEELSVKRVYSNGQIHFRLGTTRMWPIHQNEYDHFLRVNAIEYPIAVVLEEQANEIAPEPQSDREWQKEKEQQQETEEMERECDRGSSRLDCETAKDLGEKCPIYQSGANEWQVLSSDGQQYYTVRWEGDRYACTCKFHQFHPEKDCKHIEALKRYQAKSRRSYSNPPGQNWRHTSNSPHSGCWLYANDPYWTRQPVAACKIRVLYEQDGEKRDLVLDAGCTKESAIAAIPDGAKFIGTRRAA